MSPSPSQSQSPTSGPSQTSSPSLSSHPSPSPSLSSASGVGTKSRALRWLPRLLAVFGCGVGAFAYQAWPSGEDGAVGSAAKPPYLTLFLIDGCAHEVFDAELAAGRLPNIQRMMDEGLFVENGVSAFPSMTAYGYYGFLTGQDAVFGGPLGLRWYDRERGKGPFRSYVGKTNTLFNHDMAPGRQTIFEAFPDQHSLSINTYANRGAHRSEKTGWMFTMAKYKDHWWVAGLLSSLPMVRDRVAPDWPEIESRVVDLAIKDLAHRPKVQWVTFVSPDTYGHVYGLGPRYPELLRHIDTLIGRYREASRAAGLEADRVYAVVSDHGVETVSRNVDLTKNLAAAGLPAFRGEATMLWSDAIDDPPSALDPYKALVVINGNLMNYLYFQDPTGEGWRTRPNYETLRAYPAARGPVDLVRTLVETDGIEFAILRGPRGGVEVHAADGVGFVTTSSAGYAYRFEGQDPLRMPPASQSLTDGRPHAASRWLRDTREAEYPYAVVRLARLFAQEGAGDIVVTSAPGVDLAEDFELFVDNYRGGHGGLRRAQMVVPYVLSGPGIAAGRRVAAATPEDVGATLWHLLGGRPLENVLGHRLEGGE
ncbi:MAG: alkaline phosphatase family protein [Deltaproteobacteria bacterium]|nr:alkaline phosphatase family protein [Deltaproteobacteria bacterium]